MLFAEGFDVSEVFSTAGSALVGYQSLSPDKEDGDVTILPWLPGLPGGPP